ncbi:1-pyrroline-5-carboxylate dehydrogenase [subsurface metagenome]
MNAIIDEVSYDNLVEYIENARKNPDAEIIFGGNYDKSKGYFIEPTVILTKDPQYVTMVEELFGPVVTIYVYESGKFEETLVLLDKTSIYALTGAIFAQDREAIEIGMKKLVNAALIAKEKWADMSWQARASIFLKAANLLAGPYRDKINAATMLGQSKTAFQAEIDSACESIDFFRFNVQYMAEIYSHQPQSDSNTWNRLEQRPLEGFVFALTPFNFTSIAANLPTAPAIMGNTVVWKPSKTQVYAAHVLMDVYREAGLPDGVINLVFVSGPVAGKEILTHPDFAGFHFTGSTEVFHSIWKQIGDNIQIYKTYPRIVGETGGKDFIMVPDS